MKNFHLFPNVSHKIIKGYVFLRMLIWKKTFAVAKRHNTIDEAYHGAFMDDRQKIVKEKIFHPTKDENSYLGDGVYFYEHSRWLAAKWAEKQFGRDAYIGIVCASIEYGFCLNLDVPEYRLIMKRVKDHIAEKKRQ